MVNINICVSLRGLGDGHVEASLDCDVFGYSHGRSPILVLKSTGYILVSETKIIISNINFFIQSPI